MGICFLSYKKYPTPYNAYIYILSKIAQSLRSKSDLELDWGRWGHGLCSLLPLVLIFVPLQTFPEDFKMFKFPFQNEIGRALSKMKIQAWYIIINFYYVNKPC